MFRGEVYDHYVGETAVARQQRKQLLQGLEPPGGGADTDDHGSGRGYAMTDINFLFMHPMMIGA